MRSKIGKLEVDKLVPDPIDLSKVNDAVKIMSLKKMYIYAKIKNIEDKIPDVTN